MTPIHDYPTECTEVPDRRAYRYWILRHDPEVQSWDAFQAFRMASKERTREHLAKMAEKSRKYREGLRRDHREGIKDVAHLENGGKLSDLAEKLSPRDRRLIARNTEKSRLKMELALLRQGIGCGKARVIR